MITVPERLLQSILGKWPEFDTEMLPDDMNVMNDAHPWAKPSTTPCFQPAACPVGRATLYAESNAGWYALSQPAVYPSEFPFAVPSPVPRLPPCANPVEYPFEYPELKPLS